MKVNRRKSLGGTLLGAGTSTGLATAAAAPPAGHATAPFRPAADQQGGTIGSVDDAERRVAHTRD